MRVIPSIDIMGGRVVRLEKGDPERATVYEGRPVDYARRFEAAGVKLVHVVDLDGAFTGEPRAVEHVLEILGAVRTPIQVGGGIRTMGLVTRYVEAMGQVGRRARVVVGTAALESADFLREAVAACGEGELVVALDARDGRVCTKGWVSDTGEPVEHAAARLRDAGVREVLHTDISRDGVRTGPNIEASRRLAEASGLSVIVSGGVSCLDDIKAACEAAREQPLLSGIITGRAVYEGNIDIEEAVRVTERC